MPRWPAAGAWCTVDTMASLTEAIDLKRKMYFEFEDAPYHCLDVEISRPTARGGQTLVRVKMRNLDRKSTRLNSSHIQKSRMPSSA